MPDLTEQKSIATPPDSHDFELAPADHIEKINGEDILVFLDNYDERLKNEISRVREALNRDSSLTDIMKLVSDIRKLGQEIRLEAKKLETSDTNGYVRHDANNILSWSVMSLQDFARYLDTTDEVSFKEKLLIELEDAQKSWLVYKLIMQDVGFRYQDGENMVSAVTARFDQERDTADLVTALKQLLKKKLDESKIFIDIDPNSADLKIATPHGLILNMIQNSLSNAMAENVGARSFIFQIKQVENELVFSLYDDGVGMPAESLQRDNEKFICKKGTSGKGSTGLGLAFADKRLAQAQATLIITSRQKLMSESYDAIHSFPPVIAVKLESIELDRKEGTYSTCFQIRVPII